MATLILSLVTGLIKLLPEIVSLIKDIRADHKERDRQMQDLTAKQRYEIKQQITVNAIRSAVSDARNRVQGNTAIIQRSDVSSSKQQ